MSFIHVVLAAELQEELEGLEMEKEEEPAFSLKDDATCCFRGHTGIFIPNKKKNWRMQQYIMLLKCSVPFHASSVPFHARSVPVHTSSVPFQVLCSQCLCIPPVSWHAAVEKMTRRTSGESMMDR